MASVQVLEKDYSTATVSDATETIVYIPGMAGEDCSHLQDLLGKPTLFESVSAFESKVGSSPKQLTAGTSEMKATYDKSYIMAKQLLALGMAVLYEVVKNPTTGLPVTTADGMWDTLGTSAHWDKLYDKALYNPRFITSGGYESIRLSTTSEGIVVIKSVANQMVECAHFTKGATVDMNVGRGDCVALIDTEKSLTDEEDIKSLLQNMDLANGEFGSLFAPWCIHETTIDLGGIKSQDDEITNHWVLPGSFAYLTSFANMIGNNYPTYYAAAGVTRGISPTLVKPIVDFGERTAAALQSRANGWVAANPICKIEPYGYRVYGNRTLHKNAGDLTWSSFLNIRNLVSDIKKTSFAACRALTFEQKTDILWSKLCMQISPLLDKMLSGNGIEGYDLQRVATNEKAKVIGRVIIVPIEPVEDFELTVELTDSLDIVE